MDLVFIGLVWYSQFSCARRWSWRVYEYVKIAILFSNLETQLLHFCHCCTCLEYYSKIVEKSIKMVCSFMYLFVSLFDLGWLSLQESPSTVMTKAQQLSREGEEKCWIFLKGGHTSQSQNLYRVTPLYHYLHLCCYGICENSKEKYAAVSSNPRWNKQTKCHQEPDLIWLPFIIVVCWGSLD